MKTFVSTLSCSSAEILLVCNLQEVFKGQRMITVFVFFNAPNINSNDVNESFYWKYKYFCIRLKKKCGG